MTQHAERVRLFVPSRVQILCTTKYRSSCSTTCSSRACPVTGRGRVVASTTRRTRPPNADLARLIEASGLKGTHVGAATVSPIHANFIVNLGDARAADVLALMREVRRAVQERHGCVLQPEIVALGREWKDLL